MYTVTHDVLAAEAEAHDGAVLVGPLERLDVVVWAVQVRDVAWGWVCVLGALS